MLVTSEPRIHVSFKMQGVVRCSPGVGVSLLVLVEGVCRTKSVRLAGKVMSFAEIQSVENPSNFSGWGLCCRKSTRGSVWEPKLMYFALTTLPSFRNIQALIAPRSPNSFSKIPRPPFGPSVVSQYTQVHVCAHLLGFGIVVQEGESGTERAGSIR